MCVLRAGLPQVRRTIKFKVEDIRNAIEHYDLGGCIAFSWTLLVTAAG